MLKVGYDNFEITKVPPKVDVCEKRYVFNQVAAPGSTFNPTGACPATTQPDSLTSAYKAYQSTYEAAFTSAVDGEQAGAQADHRRHQGGQHRLGLVASAGPRRARADRAAVAQCGRHASP